MFVFMVHNCNEIWFYLFSVNNLNAFNIRDLVWIIEEAAKSLRLVAHELEMGLVAYFNAMNRLATESLDRLWLHSDFFFKYNRSSNAQIVLYFFLWSSFHIIYISMGEM